MREVWRLIPGFRRYQVSNLGNIRSLWYKGTSVTKVLSPVVGMDGYYKISLYNEDDERKTLRVNRLVLLSFRGLSYRGFSNRQASHLDGNRLNNRLSNLKWETSKQNHSRKFQHGTHQRGERNPKANLTEEDVRTIRRLYADGILNGVQLAKRFNVRHPTIYSILNRKLWRHM